MALARALIKRPKVLLLDEPLGALDKKLREETQFELMDLQAELGITFMVVTHDQDEAMTMADPHRRDGQGPAHPGRHAGEIYEMPGQPVRRGLRRRITLFEADVAIADADTCRAHASEGRRRLRSD